MIAALFVDPRGVYRRPGIDVWGRDRDARLYRGDLPVIAHPPCARWGWHARQFSRDRIGQDGGCFAAAIASVSRCGGVIEHPAASAAWEAFDLVRPGGWGWTRGPVTAAGGTWSCAVDQGHYGHPAPKRTWLYLVTRTWLYEPPPALRWDPSARPLRVKDLRQLRDREATPPLFADVLIALVTGQLPPGPVAGGCLPGLAPIVTSPAGTVPCCVCGASMDLARFGPDRQACSARCRQRLSRQRRLVTRARATRDLIEASRCRENS